MTLLFWLLALLDIIFIITGTGTGHYIVKSLLVPALILLLLAAKEHNGKRLLLAGLCFSWMGDVLLLFESRHALFFIAGLICFLATHVFYIIYFIRIPSANLPLLKKQPAIAVPVIAYGITLVWCLFPRLGELKIPVMVYAGVICTMLICSLYAYGKLNKAASNTFFLGALAFVLSDSLLAVNKFYQPIPYAGVLIMLTYCIAQYLIVKGFSSQDPL